MVIKIQKLTKVYNGERVLEGLSAEFKTGGRYLVKGASGAGKTTLLRLIMGLEEPDEGMIMICPDGDGKTAGHGNAGQKDGTTEGRSCEKNYKDYKKTIRNIKISAVFQEDRLCEEESAVTNIRITNPEVSTEMIRSELKKLLDAEDIDKPAAELSGGMKRRVSIVRACMAGRGIYLLDEPFTGLDAGNAKKCAEYITEKTQDGILLITSHQEEYLEYIPDLNIIDFGYERKQK